MIVNDIFKIIKRMSETDCACIVGSYNANPDAKNVDIIIISENKKNIIALLDKYFRVPNKVSDDTIQYIDTSNRIFSFLIQSKSELESKVNEIINGENYIPRICEWAMVGWLPESFLKDLSKMVIIKDKQNFLTKLKNSLKKMPKKFQKAVIDFSNRKIEYLRKKALKLSDNLLEKQICQTEILIHYIRKKYAEKGIYLHSFSNINKEILHE